MCHLQVPALNAYGRYVQRNGYSVVDHKKLATSFPVWVGFNPSYDSQSSSSPHALQLGNLAVHAVGQLSPDVTYHIQQWVRQDGQGGRLDTAWIAYNNLLGRNGHVFVGKIDAPAPSPFSQWFALSRSAPSGSARRRSSCDRRRPARARSASFRSSRERRRAR